MNTSTRLFVDMDGTLARFHDEVQYLERMWEKDFFRNLKPFENMVKAIKQLAEQEPEIEIYILSAAIDGEPPFCYRQKNQWLDEQLPEIDNFHRIFTKVGAPKSEYIPGGIDKNDFLLDDYNKNLDEWLEFGGSSVKCVNNINHKGRIGKLWDGELVRTEDTPERICSQLTDIIYGSRGPVISKTYGGRR
ncbi:5'-nucleotidase [Ruminococcus sp. Marseille-P6503]|uniref:5' nucleotidase, NT5C type n=1 Tax=Ruminococcus sp. Marseille-P6503 TaxID=2364796 RepID=UPI000F529FDC|nr:5'-nucleotidase [Ruminococcus sp. Marseille-P6503]